MSLLSNLLVINGYRRKWLLLRNESAKDKNRLTSLLKPFIGARNSNILYASYPNLGRISRLSTEDIKAVLTDVPDSKIQRLKDAFELAFALIDDEEPDYYQIKTAGDLAQLMTKFFRSAKNEKLYSILLDASRNVIDVRHIAEGSVDAVLSNPRDIFAPALELKACYIAIVHYHPNGNHKPSRSDIEVAKDCAQIGKALSVPLLDSIIMGTKSKGRPTNYSSLYNLGYLSR